MLILALVVVGSASYLNLNVDRFPDLDLPTVRVFARLPGASPAEMEAQMAHPLEETINTVQGIKELRSINMTGISLVIVTFELDQPIDVATQDVRDRVSASLSRLPREADPPVVSKSDSDISPVLTLAISGNRSPRELTEIADKIVKVQLERSPGVGEIEIQGGLMRAINIWIDPDRLAAYQIPITAVRDAITRQNSETPGGNVTGVLQERTLRTVGKISDSAGFGDLVVTTIDGVPVRIRDIGRVEDGTKEARSIARLNGTPTVMLEIRRQSGANTVAVIEGLKEKIAALATQLPGDLQLDVLRDQSRYIYEALHEINRHLVLGSILACLIVFLFMRSWQAMVIAGVAIPSSVIATFGMMRALDFTLNNVTMLALVLMVGIVIDDAIVVLENIFRFIEEKRMHPFEAARKATAEIGLAVMATTFSLVVIFVPVSFMSSIAGRFLFQFGITAAVAVLVSLVVSFTLTPMMSARLLRPARPTTPSAAPQSRAGFYAWIDRAYTRLLTLAMTHRLWVSLASVAIILSSVPLYRMVPQDFIPGNADEGEFDVSANAPEGTSLTAMLVVAREIEDALRSTPGIALVISSAGGNGTFGQPNNARFYVALKPHKDRVFSFSRLISSTPWKAFQGNYSQSEIVRTVRAKLKKFPDLRCSIRNPQTFNIGGPNFDIDFSLLGPDLEALSDYANRLREMAPQLGLLDADTTLKLDKPELRVQIDRERAAQLGVDTAEVSTALRLMVGGDDRVSDFYDPAMNEVYDVELRLEDGQRNDPEAISRLYVPGSGNQLVRMDNLVEIVPSTTASRIDRLDRQRQVSLRTAIAPGFALADRLDAVRGAVEELGLPSGYSTRVSGKGRELETTFREFSWAFLLSIILMYLILASQFESIVHPFTILLSLPLAVPFALVSLWITGNTINLYSTLGILVLFGVVKKNAILQIDHMNTLRAQGLERAAAILQANRDRLRPILMTTLTLIAGMTPLAIGTGPGAEERRAIAVVVIGGQSLSLLLTLIATPVAYSLLDDLANRFRKKPIESAVEAGLPSPS